MYNNEIKVNNKWHNTWDTIKKIESFNIQNQMYKTQEPKCYYINKWDHIFVKV